MSLEDEYIKNSSFEAVRNAIELLPDIQKRRVKKYYYDNIPMRKNQSRTQRRGDTPRWLPRH